MKACLVQMKFVSKLKKFNKLLKINDKALNNFLFFEFSDLYEKYSKITKKTLTKNLKIIFQCLIEF